LIYDVERHFRILRISTRRATSLVVAVAHSLGSVASFCEAFQMLSVSGGYTDSSPSFASSRSNNDASKNSMLLMTIDYTLSSLISVDCQPSLT
jgi:hypothetical protein